MSYTTMHWNKSFGFVCVRCLGKLQEGHLPPDEMCVKCILGQPVPFDFPPDFYAPRDSHQKLSDTAHDHLLAGMDTVGPVKDDSSKNRMDLIPATALGWRGVQPRSKKICPEQLQTERRTESDAPVRGLAPSRLRLGIR